jgi:thiol peroxidase
MENKNAVKVKGNPVTLIGEEIRFGQKVGDFKVLNTDLGDVLLSNFKNKIKLIASVPSLDTPVCDLEIKRFNDEASKLSKDLVIMFISMDLPFAQKRFCQANEIKMVKTFSDHRYADFGQKFGVLIKELRLLARAIFIIDKDDVIKYIQVVPELISPPDYDQALSALKKIVEDK